MENLQIESVIAKIKELQENYDFNDVFEYVNKEELLYCETIEEIAEIIENANEDHEITNYEIIYYANAIEYLKQNDQYLAESIEIAVEFRYSIENINNELLASLHSSRQNEEDFQTFLEEIKELEID